VFFPLFPAGVEEESPNANQLRAGEKGKRNRTDPEKEAAARTEKDLGGITRADDCQQGENMEDDEVKTRD